MKHIWKNKRLFLPKRRKCDEIAKGHFSKSTETARWELPRKAAYSEHSISKAGYVIAVLAIVRTELGAREVSSFCDFWKMTSCECTLFYSFSTQGNVIFFDVLGKEYYIADLCPILHFNALDFNVCRSEEVIRLFWRSVYMDGNLGPYSHLKFNSL